MKLILYHWHSKTILTHVSNDRELINEVDDLSLPLQLVRGMRELYFFSGRVRIHFERYIK